MFGLFKKKEIELSYQTVAGWVLVLPAKHAENSLVNQVYSIDERKRLIQIFEEKGLDYMTMERPSDGELLFDAQPASMREAFIANKNYLNDTQQEVREYEFFRKL